MPHRVPAPGVNGLHVAHEGLAQLLDAVVLEEVISPSFCFAEPQKVSCLYDDFTCSEERRFFVVGYKSALAVMQAH